MVKCILKKRCVAGIAGLGEGLYNANMSEMLLGRAEKFWHAFFSDPFENMYREKHLINKPFYFSGNNRAAVLLVHGWTSTAYEFRSLGKRLHEEGFTVYAPLLSGHGTVPKDLESVTWKDWFHDVERAYLDLQRTHDRVFVGGTSIGGNIALLLAKCYGNIDGLILLGTPFRGRAERISYGIFKLWSFFSAYKRKILPPTPESFRSTTRVTAYDTYPVQSAFEAFQLICESRKNLSLVTQPCYLAQAHNDHLLSKNNMHMLTQEIASEKKIVRTIYGAYHTFIADPDKTFVHDDIARFLKQVAGMSV